VRHENDYLRLLIVMPDELKAQVEDSRRQQREIPDRATAVRALIAAGRKAEQERGRVAP